MNLSYISDEQQRIVESDSKHKLINGCAGSHKTDTLIKCAVYDIHKRKRPILFLTMVGSVTVEIKTRLENYLSIRIHKQGKSNHFVGFYQKVPICISNYDAWVHLMLEKTREASEYGDIYSKKVDILLEKTKKEEFIACKMKTGKTVGLLIIDEAQDLLAKKMEIVVNIANKNKQLDVHIAGDYLQTLFAEDTSEISSMSAHSMNVFKRIPSHAFFDLTKCMRCPKAHVAFNNLLMGNIQKKYAIPNMLASNENMIDKPLLFTHLSTTNNTTARINAEQITVMIKTLMKLDQTIQPNDIAIIMSKSNRNEVFNQLQDTLPKMYESIGKGTNLVCYMSTYGDGRHVTLDWTEAEGKTVMLSIHGDKGKGHRVVFLLGLTEKSIPREYHIYTPNEIMSESMLNVGLTRSTKYLFVGFSFGYPSRYLKSQEKFLAKHAYCSWEVSQCEAEPYKSIIEAISDTCQRPEWNATYKFEKTNVGSKSELAVKDDLSKDIDQASNLVDFNWNKNKKQIDFGTRQVIHGRLHEDHYCILGIYTLKYLKKT